jgi:hypothetical protein
VIPLRGGKNQFGVVEKKLCCPNLGGILGEGWSLALEGVYNGCMGWIHAPPPPLAAPPNFLWKSIILPYFLEILVFFLKLFILQTHVDLFVLTVQIFILWKFGNKKNEAIIAIGMQVFCNPSITKNVFTMLRRSPTSKIFSKSASHATHYESQEAPLRVIQVFHANGSQRLLTLPGRVQKNIYFFLQTL